MADPVYTDASDGEEYTGRYKLHNAAEAGDSETLRAAIEGKVEAVQAHAALFAAQAGAGDLEAFITRGLEFDVRDENECTPLHLALLNGHVHCAAVLLQRGAQVHPTCEGSPALHIVASMAALPHYTAFAMEATALLLQYGASAYSLDDNQRTALHWAALANHSELCSHLVAAAREEAERHIVEVLEATAAAAPSPKPGVLPLPPLLPMLDDKGNSALHLAARHGLASALVMLLDAAAAVLPGQPPDDPVVLGDGSLLTRNKLGQAPLHCAVLSGCVECVQLLLAAAPAAAELCDRRGHTALQLALRRRDAVVARALGAAESDSRVTMASGGPRTLLVTSPDCLAHHTCTPPIIRGLSDVPPENVQRLEVLVHPTRGILRTNLFADCVWAHDCHPAAMTDVLRVHEWAYVSKVRDVCTRLAADDRATANLDSDTAVSQGSYRAALKAAGSVCHALDEVVEGRVKRAFCAVRPPGHHAGPTGVVPNKNEQAGSHGFCLLNNVAIGAAYAMSMYRHRGIRRVALLDFDVHHGNGTEACVTNTAPSVSTHPFRTPYSAGAQHFHHWRPWFDGDDRRNILFASVQGYGRKALHSASWVYPGSGATCDTAAVDAHADGGEDYGDDGILMTDSHADGAACGAGGAAGPPQAAGAVPEDPDGEFVYREGQLPRTDGPRVINVGVPGPGTRVTLWRRAWRDKILPAVVNFAPDLIIVSAGFDAHRKDEINFQYIGIREHDFAWITEQIVQVANRVCQGRVVSVLEGGYRIQGEAVSAFSRSVAAHVRALHEPNEEPWDEADAAAERDEERRRREAKAADRERKAAARAAKFAAEVAELQAEAAEASGGHAVGEAADGLLPMDTVPAGAADADKGLGEDGRAEEGHGAAPVAAGLPSAALSEEQLEGGAGVAGTASVQGGTIKEPVAAAASVQGGTAPPAEGGPGEGTLGVEGTGGARPSKRRRGPAVDYVALNRKLAEESAQQS